MQELVAKLYKEMETKRFGKYRGIVVERNDPKKLGRLKVMVPSVMGSEVSGWALPCFPFGGAEQQGNFSVPELDATVWVEFEEGNLSHPIWTGTFYAAQAEAPEAAFTDNQPDGHLIQTRSGHQILLNEDANNQTVTIRHSRSASIELADNGSVTLKDKSGNQLCLNADTEAIQLTDTHDNSVLMEQGKVEVKQSDGCTLTLGSGGVVKVKGPTQVTLDGGLVQLGGEGGEPLVKGLAFLSEFATHTHVASPTGGPTSPPVVPLSPGVLSTKVFSN